MSILVAFTAKLKKGVEEKYRVLSAEVLEEARKQPGLLFLDRGRSVMQKRGIISVSEWVSEEDLENWKNHPVHRRAQEIALRELFETHVLKKGKGE
ncbi:MAG: antibiotic biosynthesis monooxygenase [Deltaproteobacteria bacterium]|nr:antibiotic biosynthesis monooxygenase [Deltaproteobacteria bacterium]